MSHRTGSGPARMQPGTSGAGRPRRQPGDAVLTWAGRLVGAGLLAAMAGIHIHLYAGGGPGGAPGGPAPAMGAEPIRLVGPAPPLGVLRSAAATRHPPPAPDRADPAA